MRDLYLSTCFADKTKQYTGTHINASHQLIRSDYTSCKWRGLRLLSRNRLCCVCWERVLYLGSQRNLKTCSLQSFVCSSWPFFFATTKKQSKWFCLVRLFDTTWLIIWLLAARKACFEHNVQQLSPTRRFWHRHDQLRCDRVIHAWRAASNCGSCVLGQGSVGYFCVCWNKSEFRSLFVVSLPLGECTADSI